MTTVMVVTTTIYVNTAVIMTMIKATIVIMTMAATKTMIMTMIATTNMTKIMTTTKYNYKYGNDFQTSSKRQFYCLLNMIKRATKIHLHFFFKK